ncbi:hypothetical protein [Rheinheimera sp.]|uniref:hypothetical protein n=1 Tax=Rheinheimera sp. TaxID=1869214 RepID=UPI00404785B9
MHEQLQQDPHHQGDQCFFARGQMADNPYVSGTAEFQSWERGYYSAAAEDFDDHRCGADATWVDSEKFCNVCGKKVDELE